MEFRLLTENEIRIWYETELTCTFIPQECKPLDDIFRLIAENRYEIWGLFDGAALLGYACLWKSPHLALVLLDYLGVTALRRNAGLGGEILRRLQAQGRPLVTESELPVEGDSAEENAIRTRRIAFYARHGFTAAYPMATCGMAWQAMVHAPEMALVEVMAQHKALYGPARTDVVVPLGEGERPAMPYWMEAKRT
ncbi:MAG: GNAT family N-acetyltransferase [Oscillospiraceae bacterium]|nr:GNAT family N-acetyltransferase [Oscillospiraceae bacterium]